jgi:hypothetical protein
MTKLQEHFNTAINDLTQKQNEELEAKRHELEESTSQAPRASSEYLNLKKIE